MTKASEDELVEKVARAIWTQGGFIAKDDFGSETIPVAFDEAKAAIATARPLIAQHEREKVLREMLDEAVGMLDRDWPDCFVSGFARKHGITLEDK